MKLDIQPFFYEAHTNYDGFICAMGYESRSTHAAAALGKDATTRVAVGFDYHHCGSLAENKKWFAARGFFSWFDDRTPYLCDEQFVEDMLDLFCSWHSDKPARIPRLCIDISCFSLVRMAILVESIVRLGLDVDVDFVYSAGRGYGKGREPRQIEVAGPVTRRFAGWTTEPDLPVHAVFGLGLEYQKAVGAFELLNPSDAFAFATLGTSDSLDHHISEANRLFFPLIDERKRFPFRLDRPMELYHRMRSLVHGILREARPVLLPMGPKIFGTAALLIAESLFPRLSVWRISTGRSAVPVDIHASGPISGYSVSFRVN